MQKINHKHEQDKFIKATLQALPANASADIKALVTQCFDKIPSIDLENIDPKEAAKIAASVYDFLGSREKDTPKIRITPKKLSSIIEILNDDMPFLVDSLAAELSRQSIKVNWLIHPVIHLKREKNGHLAEIIDASKSKTGASAESFIRIDVSKIQDKEAEEKLMADLARVLANVRYSVTDWSAMRSKIAESISDVKKTSPAFRPEEISEVCDFLEWINSKNFVYLGYIEYDFYDKKGNRALSVVPGSELGIFKDEDEELKPKGLEALPPEILHFALIPQLIEITKSMRKATVHRAVPMDYIGIKRFDSAGNVIGERRFLGLFTSNVYYQTAGDIPFIRLKIERVLTKANFDPAGYDGKTLKSILEFTPRDELFQFSEDELFDYSMGVLSLETKPAVRLFIRRDIFERYVSCIVFLPRENYRSDLREEVQNFLTTSFEGKVTSFYTQMTDSPLVRLQVIVTTRPAHVPEVNIAQMEAEIARLASRWSDALSANLSKHFDDEQADAMLRMYSNAFTKAYISDHNASMAVYDIQKINEVIESGTPALELFRNNEDPDNIIHLKWYNPRAQVPLSDVLPILENMGFKVIDEQPYLVKPANAEIKEVWIRDFILTADAALLKDIKSLNPLFKEALASIWRQETENDKLDALVLNAHFAWREILVLRAYTKYLRQVNFPYTQEAIAASFNTNPDIARAIYALFYAKFNPDASSHDTQKLLAGIETKLGNVKNLADDRILRRFVDMINATLRTNYFQTVEDGGWKPYLSFKVESGKVPELPLPRPHAEIFVYSARMEGIHLRGGKVARGGLRWSDRRDDFRTEILGLMKAQMVKNSVIVPVGSKGGFVLKRETATREAFMEEGVACYKILLSGLLDITDNIVKGKVVPPKLVVRHDEDDPYLVVAADKGTATFSDYANGVSKAYGFWLDDAFASGGSVGYDHKKMAITAKGAFISVARHFREMGLDIYKKDFTVVGIGDMAGDVFGNGMLLSKHIQLVAAFNHMHIFLDPNPDAASSFKERDRLFKLPRSSWKDYNEKLISEGGGIFERSAKSIPLSPEVQKLIGTTKKSLSPDDLIRALLLAEVDLLWNGGIGTYVKAEYESHEQVGDRTNNALRVNGKELRCKVVGEGGNLGFTQRGRIEYALNGGHINTDAIDNSAGVDCSDHEVNIKIGLGSAVASGKLTLAKRDTFLAGMTDEVAQLVLRDNQLQTQALTIAEMQAVTHLDEHIRLMHRFESRGELDRVVEFLPSDKQLLERKNENKGLTRPELAVLLAYSKMVLYQELLKSSLPDDAYFADDLVNYFPTAMKKEFAKEISHHQLKREIIATVVTNDIVNSVGITLIHSVAEDTGMSPADVARAYAVASKLFGLRTLWEQIEALDGKIAVNAQVRLFHRIKQFAKRMILWLLRNVPQPMDVEATLDHFTKGIKTYADAADSLISASITEEYKQRIEEFESLQVPVPLAENIASLDIMRSAPNLVLVASESGKKLVDVGKIYFEIGMLLRLEWLRQQADKIVSSSHWDTLAISSMIGSIIDEQRRLTTSVAENGKLEEWQEKHAADINRFITFMDDLKASDTITLPKLIIAEKKIKEIG